MEKHVPGVRAAKTAGIAGAVCGGLMLLSATAAFALSALLPPGGTVPVPATTAATEPDLAGGVLQDTLIPFKITAPSGSLVCSGQLQDRVVRSAKTGKLHFYYRIRNTNGPGIIARMMTSAFGLPDLRVGYRTDGLGAVAPGFAARSAVPGAVVTFGFASSPAAPVFSCARHEESRFILIKTNAAAFHPGGTTVLFSTTGGTAKLPTVMP